jgi:hypothetical protein
MDQTPQEGGEESSKGVEVTNAEFIELIRTAATDFHPDRDSALEELGSIDLDLAYTEALVMLAAKAHDEEIADVMESVWPESAR